MIDKVWQIIRVWIHLYYYFFTREKREKEKHERRGCENKRGKERRANGKVA